MTASQTLAAATTLERLRGWWSLVVRVVLLELRIYANIARAIARRPAIAPGAAGFGYHRPVLTILLVFIGLSAVEIPIIDLIVHRWPVPRIALLILGIWGVTWMIGLLCAYLMRPHTVGPEGIRVREGLETDIPLSWDDIASVSRSARIDEPKTPRITEDDDGRMLSLRMQHETNVEIALEGPTPVRLPGRAPKGGEQLVTVVRLWTDDVEGFMDAVRRNIP
ncbi:hypothetical protein [Microbacterium sp. SS28]|uniref:hypothetical protein n=1 Tax=Microbacterium sp. SS28 TaxID=2919948 RepID=UPI001FA99846|nr:hypothetical protein [Microbacterium sp. SS28]